MSISQILLFLIIFVTPKITEISINNFHEIYDYNILKSKLIAKAHQTNNLKCDFAIRNHDKLSGEIELSEGKYFYNSPKQIIWKYQKASPYSIVLLSTKKHFIIENNNKNNYDINIDPKFKLLNKVLKQYFNGKCFSTKSYKIKYYKNTTSYLLQLVSIDNNINNEAQNIDLRFNKTDYGLEYIKLNFNNLEFLELEFSQRYINTKIVKQEFDKYK